MRNDPLVDFNGLKIRPIFGNFFLDTVNLKVFKIS